MAEATNAAAPKAPEAPKAKKEKVQHQELFPTAEAAVKEATERTKGPRSPFKVSYNGKDYFVVHNNEGRACGVVGLHLGMTAASLMGKAPKAQKVMGVDDVKAIIGQFPEAERNALIEQLKKLQGGKK